MKIKLLVEKGKARQCREPFAGADHAVAFGPCPGCGRQDSYGVGTYGFKVAGTGKRPSADDRAWEADAVALCCNKHVGILRVEPNTLFGVREDEAVSRLGIRIY